MVGFLAITSAYSQMLTPKLENQKWGFVNEQDSFVVEPQYTAVGDFLNNYTWVNLDGKVKYNNFPVGGKWGVVDMSGKLICPVDYDFVDLCSQEIVAVNRGGEMSEKKISGGKWGFFDLKSGKEIVTPIYDQVGPFYQNGRAWALKSGDLVRNILSSDMMNEKGKIEDRVRKFYVFDDFKIESLFQEYNKVGKWALIDKSGNEITQFIYELVGDFYYGSARVSLDGKFGLIDESGKILIECQYDEITDCYEQDILWVKKQNKWGLVDKYGKILLECTYEDCGLFIDGVAWVKDDNSLFGLVNYKGEVLIEPRYIEVGVFYNGVSTVRSKADALGLVNTKGKEIARTLYGATALKFGVTQFRSNDKIYSFVSHPSLGTSWIDQDGNTIIRGTKAVFKITDIIPEALWDF